MGAAANCCASYANQAREWRYIPIRRCFMGGGCLVVKDVGLRGYSIEARALKMGYMR